MTIRKGLNALNRKVGVKGSLFIGFGRSDITGKSMGPQFREIRKSKKHSRLIIGK